MSTVISGATIIDGVANLPLEGKSIWIEAGRIKAIGGHDELAAIPGAKLIDARGKYVIPGLMNANVHLFVDIRMETLVRYEGRYEELIAEAAQVALKNGLTTVFDTWGPRKPLMAVRDKIHAGEIPGSRLFCGGNIIGLDGPFSADFLYGPILANAQGMASSALSKRINALWVENVGRHLMWLTPEQVAEEVRAYIATGIDFIKYASNDHVPGAFLAFSPPAQTLMVEEAHRAGITAQAHTMSVEGLRIAIEAGCNLIQHANITGPVAIPEKTLELFARKKSWAVVFPFTERGLEWIKANTSEIERVLWSASDTNARNLIRVEAPLLMANDGAVLPPDALDDWAGGKTWQTMPNELALGNLAEGHFIWFKAMEEKNCPPMEMLRAATRNIAVAYGKDRDLGTIERGKIADLLILDKNPLQSADNYRGIHMILKQGAVVDREALPTRSILTAPMPPPGEEEASYVPFLRRFPMCPMCVGR